jgi:uncharacterized protein
VVVVDTGALLALLDADEEHHDSLRRLYEEAPQSWILPWAILPEVDYLLGTQLGQRAQESFWADLVDGAFVVDWGREDDLRVAQKLNRTYRSLKLGLVDAVVMATAERLKASAIATLDRRDFSAVKLRGSPKLLPRDA